MHATQILAHITLTLKNYLRHTSNGIGWWQRNGPTRTPPAAHRSRPRPRRWSSGPPPRTRTGAMSGCAVRRWLIEWRWETFAVSLSQQV